MSKADYVSGKKKIGLRPFGEKAGNTHVRTHARARARTHAQTHARTHVKAGLFDCWESNHVVLQKAEKGLRSMYTNSNYPCG